MALTAIFVWGNMSTTQDSLRTERDNARLRAAASAQETNVAVWAAKHGITQIVSVDAWNNNPTAVELAVDPTNPKLCSVAFEFNGKALVLPETDAVGNVYHTLTATDGAEAQALLNDICAPEK